MNTSHLNLWHATEEEEIRVVENEVDDFVSAYVLTPRQIAFVKEYVIDLNADQAAWRAGYRGNGHKLLKFPPIAFAIERLQAQRATRVGVTPDSVLHEMSILANSDITHYTYDENTGVVSLVPGAPEGALGAIQSVKKRKTIRTDAATGDIVETWDVEIKLWDKPSSLKLMGRHIGLFPNTVELTGKGGNPIELTAVSAEDLRERALALAAKVETTQE